MKIFNNYREEKGITMIVLTQIIVVASILALILIKFIIWEETLETIENPVHDMSRQEVEAFNLMFSSYEGIQDGTVVKDLIKKLMTIYNVYSSDLEKQPIIRIYGNDYQTMNDFIQLIQTIENKEYYYTSVEYENGLVHYIYIEKQ